ncbi:hypothetical protein OTK49_21610 [Vibrio coralliirubri]|uniref:hypothetical protein n=1 Tax=Vibrio coralliirubri TaxID=1516159 RepID=UPI002285064A|nr:hypothetical protein [Vibrio coralliirubri]MCY9865120.1 hypothetical protein [Vibrio coralliirubri]
MNNQIEINQKLGFTPIKQEEVFSLSPKLKELFKQLGEFDVHFKEPNQVKVDLASNQKLIQGSITLPHSPEVIDFELATDYLMTNANLVTMTRLEDSQVWGDSISVSNVIAINNVNELKGSLTYAVSHSASESSLLNTKALDDANTVLESKVEERNKHLAKIQASVEKIDPSKHKI